MRKTKKNSVEPQKKVSDDTRTQFLSYAGGSFQKPLAPLLDPTTSTFLKKTVPRFWCEGNIALGLVVGGGPHWHDQQAVCREQTSPCCHANQHAATCPPLKSLVPLGHLNFNIFLEDIFGLAACVRGPAGLCTTLHPRITVWKTEKPQVRARDGISKISRHHRGHPVDCWTIAGRHLHGTADKDLKRWIGHPGLAKQGLHKLTALYTLEVDYHVANAECNWETINAQSKPCGVDLVAVDSANFDFGQLFFSISANFDFSQF